MNGGSEAKGKRVPLCTRIFGTVSRAWDGCRKTLARKRNSRSAHVHSFCAFLIPPPEVLVPRPWLLEVWRIGTTTLRRKRGSHVHVRWEARASTSASTPMRVLVFSGRSGVDGATLRILWDDPPRWSLDSHAWRVDGWNFTSTVVTPLLLATLVSLLRVPSSLGSIARRKSPSFPPVPSGVFPRPRVLFPSIDHVAFVHGRGWHVAMDVTHAFSTPRSKPCPCTTGNEPTFPPSQKGPHPQRNESRNTRLPRRPRVEGWDGVPPFPPRSTSSPPPSLLVLPRPPPLLLPSPQRLIRSIPIQSIPLSLSPTGERGGWIERGEEWQQSGADDRRHPPHTSDEHGVRAETSLRGERKTRGWDAKREGAGAWSNVGRNEGRKGREGGEKEG